MAANVKILPRNFIDTGFGAEIPRTDEITKRVFVFCAIALMVFSLVASYGIDLSPGFF